MNTYNCNKSSDFIKHYTDNFNKIKPKRVLEIGIQGGGSLKMWHEFFQNAEIVGIDIDEKCRGHIQDGIIIEIGNQIDINFGNYILV